MAEAYQKSIETLLEELDVTAEGLSTREAQKRLAKHGPNELEHPTPISPWQIFLEQFTSPVVWVLLGAAIITAALSEWIDFLVITIVIITNAIVGLIQEYKAERAIESLKEMLALQAHMLRDGKITKIPAREVVPGDIIIIETGDRVAADLRLIESVELHTQEASLTGESTPIGKIADAIKKICAIGDRKNMAFAGTTITNGRGKGLVVATGTKTEMGKIATLLGTTKTDETPLQCSLKTLGMMLAIATVLICITIFVLGALRGQELIEVFLQAVALAVAAIPEGLPAVVTITLALGVRRMTASNALIRKLPSAETLGSCSVICTDKTGTLTHNEMTVRSIYVNDSIITITGTGYAPEGKLSATSDDAKELLLAGALCNNATLTTNKQWNITGDPTEGALLVSAAKAGIDLGKLAKQFPRIHENPFSSERKRMSTIHRTGTAYIMYHKGATEIILESCDRILLDGKPRKITPAHKKKILSAQEAFARQGMRVLGFANKTSNKQEVQEKGLIFLGLQAMIDPPRPEVKESIRICNSAGIRIIMITGDHLTTAQAIAEELGIPGKAISGTDLATLNLDAQVESIGVYARVDPEHKIRIVEALKNKGHIVAMTGDGVNDAPALKRADIGIAMGITGTDVAKEASAMVLADDNFATIVRAVREGRKIYDNIRKFVMYLLSSNIGEVLTVFGGAIAGLPPVIIARQILWMNLVTDLFPALALGIEHGEPTLMERPPRQSDQKLIDKRRWVVILSIGAVMMSAALGAFTYAYRHGTIGNAQTLAFTSLVFMQLTNVLVMRSERHTNFELRPNARLFAAIAISLILQYIVVQTPFFAGIFGDEPLTVIEWSIAISAGIGLLALGEIIKVINRRLDWLSS
ncbi:calcium-translocating P-type ATPase, SERCA-type [Candidatus Woesearchaeota archaeon]|nr:calcium-translocating P-type ATPase, SERCA-type [Candidatus Woesearchaeota archaeon]